ncbi:MAG TPA: c-type cytochrome [Gemmatimonadales bacterium]|nr:c-type cytochrome [Gemmatimonadales bacterium]
MRVFTNPEIRFAFACVLAAACAPKPAPQPTEAELVARGRTLVTVGGCNDCHSPKIFTAQGPVPDTTRRLSGHPADSKIPAVPAGVIGPEQWGAITSNDFTAWAGPWGVSFTANLTPDATGLASYTPEIFIQTIRTGKHAGVGRPILPPMPWPYYATLSDDDLRAIFAYLRSLPPISNKVPDPIPPGGKGQ